MKNYICLLPLLAFTACSNEGSISPLQVEVGVDKTISIESNSIKMNPIVSDNGTSFSWEKLGGLGAVTFDDQTYKQPTVTFDSEGVYVLELSVSDGELSESDTIIITVNDETKNSVPQVDAGVGQVISLASKSFLANSIQMNPAVSGGSFEGADLSYSWTKQSGEGVVTFDSPITKQPTVTFDSVGVYVLKLSVSDGELTGSDTTIVTVNNDGDYNGVEFKESSLSAVNATVSYLYSSSLANSTDNPNVDGELSFFKTGGPDWLTVHESGALSGTPGYGDVGLNSFSVEVRFQDRINTATLQIDVKNQVATMTTNPGADPGTGPWQRPEDVAAECNLDPELLEKAADRLGFSFAVVRYGKLCYESYSPGFDAKTHIFSATKTLGAVTVGALIHQSKDLPENGLKTGPLSEFQKVDHWLDWWEYGYNRDATVAHVLGMEAHNIWLDYGWKIWIYDVIGAMQINTLSTIINTVVQQDTANLGNNIGEFYLKHVANKLGFEDSNWGHLNSNKIFATSWETSLKDMARLGLMMLNGGVWNGERIMDLDYLYNQTHVSFEDGGKHYGYLTWLSNGDDCTPNPIHTSYPHGVSGAPDCQRREGCDQTFDVGVSFAAGMGGQWIIQHRGLDMVIVAKNSISQLPSEVGRIWDAIRPAVIAHDPVFSGNEKGFCTAYREGDYAPDLKLWEDGR